MKVKNFKLKKIALIFLIFFIAIITPINNTNATNVTSTPNIESFKSLVTTLMTTGNGNTYNISQYKLTIIQLATAYFDIAKKEAIAYYTNNDMSYECTIGSDGYVATFKLKNVHSDFAIRYIQMKNVVNTVLTDITSDMTNLEKLVYVHDYLAYNAQYDKSTVIPNDSYNAYGIMVNKTGVCDGYSKALMMFMNLFGIPCNYVISTQMVHSWITVSLNGYYYNVDATWDDPTKDTLGRVYHEFLLRTNSEFENELIPKHYGWVKYSANESNMFSNWEIHNVKSRIIHSNGDWYYIDLTGSLVKSDIMGSNKTVVVNGNNNKLYTVEALNGGWLYTQGNKIMYCDYDGSNIREVLTTNQNNGIQDVIYYLYISNNILTYTVYSYTDITNEDTFISKIAYEYDLSNMSDLPDNDIPPYNPLEYIESTTNSNSIDTKYLANNNTTISLDVATTLNNNYGNLVYGYNNSCNRLVIRQESINGLYVAYGWYNSKVYILTSLEKFNITQAKAITYINGVVVRKATPQIYQMTNTLKIGSSKCRIYGCKIYDGNTLIRDYIPVLDTHGIACLYDKVSCSFFYGKYSFSYTN